MAKIEKGNLPLTSFLLNWSFLDFHKGNYLQFQINTEHFANNVNAYPATTPWKTRQ